MLDSAEPGRCGETERGLMYIDEKQAENEKAVDSFKGINGFRGFYTLIWLRGQDLNL
ncbi:MAG: hypothetical protein ABWY02_08405 [Telluria sp.]